MQYLRKTILITGIIFILLISFVSANGIGTIGLVSEYRMENNTVDSFGANNGTIIGTVTNVTGILGSGMFFNGVSTNYISVPDSSTLTLDNAFTICFWKNELAVSNWNVQSQYVSKYNTTSNERGYFVGRGATSGKPYLSVTICNTTGTTSYPSNSVFGWINTTGWYFICAAWNRSANLGKVYMYVNGTESSSYSTQNNKTYALHDNAQPLLIGAYASGARPVNGTIDEVRIWNTDLTAAQISKMYSDDLSGVRPGDVTSNSCTYSGSGNWVINLSDSCNITTAVNVSGNITFTETGYAMFNNTINMSNLMGINNNTGAILYVGSNVYLIIRGA